MAKYIKCPNCGHVFKSPAMDNKRFGLGFTIPGMGVVRCPECKTDQGRRKYTVVTEQEAEVEKLERATRQPEKRSDEELIEGSKFEDE